MALTQALVYADLASARAAGGFPFDGINFDHLAWAVAYAVVPWFQTGGVTLQGVSVGTAGMGTINAPTSKVTLVPKPSLVIGGLSSAGMVGPLSVSLGTVIALALAKVVTTYGQYTGRVAGVGVGADVSRAVIADTPKLVAQLLSYMSAMLGSGPASARMASGLGSGIAALALTLTGTGNVIGTSSTASGTGQSTSVVV